MATALSAATISARPFANTAPLPSQKKPVISASSTPISYPFKLRKQRKNYLRPKILKNLNPKPQQNTPLQEPPSTITGLPPLEQQPQLPSDQFPGQELKQFEVPVGIINVGVGNFSKISIFKIGFFLVGAFVFQTIFAVWILGSADSDHKDGILDSDDETRVSELGPDGNVSGNVHVDESEFEEKIAEIQAMARKVRERERMAREREERMVLKARNNGLDDEDIDVFKTDIGKEVDRRLVMLRKSLKNSYEKPSVGHLRKDGVDDDGFDVDDGIGALMFKKKFKFRSPFIGQSEKPKGFQDSDDCSVSNTKENSEILEKTRNVKDLLYEDQKLDLPNGNVFGSDPMTLEEDGRKQTTRKKLRKGKERIKLGKAEPLISKYGNKESSKGVMDSDSQTDSWWLTLPYVFTVLMHTDRDDGLPALFTIRSMSDTNDDLSYVVAFEDRGDASNFCYLLQSFFEEMDGFRTDIVPIPIKDFVKAVKSDNMKVLVVKKGKLKLYAGQSLSDVELALQSMVGQS